MRGSTRHHHLRCTPHPVHRFPRSCPTADKRRRRRRQGDPLRQPLQIQTTTTPITQPLLSRRQLPPPTRGAQPAHRRPFLPVQPRRPILTPQIQIRRTHTPQIHTLRIHTLRILLHQPRRRSPAVIHQTQGRIRHSLTTLTLSRRRRILRQDTLRRAVTRRPQVAIQPVNLLETTAIRRHLDTHRNLDTHRQAKHQRIPPGTTRHRHLPAAVHTHPLAESTHPSINWNEEYRFDVLSYKITILSKNILKLSIDN